MKLSCPLEQAIEIMAHYIENGWKVEEYDFYLGADFTLISPEGQRMVIVCLAQ